MVLEQGRSHRAAGRRNVAVIGAGVSGLTTTKSLLEEGLEPVVYEQSSHLSFVQNNGNVQKSEPLLQRAKQAMSQDRVLVKSELDDSTRGITGENAANMKDIAHHAQEAIMLHLGNSQKAPSPEDHVVGQTAQ